MYKRPERRKITKYKSIKKLPDWKIQYHIFQSGSFRCKIRQKRPGAPFSYVSNGKGGLIVFCQRIPLRCFSADQHRCDHLVYRFADRCVFAVFMFFNLLHQKFHRFSSEHIDLLSHGADREDGVSGGGGVVEADDQVVFREFTVFSYQQIDQDAGVSIVGDENALFLPGESASISERISFRCSWEAV